jgi:hypothetical protein
VEVTRPSSSSLHGEVAPAVPSTESEACPRAYSRVGLLGWVQLLTVWFGSRPSRAARRFAVTLPCVLAGSACTDPKPGPQLCDVPQPAFRFEATTVDEPLPSGLTVQVEFGGAQSESYTLGSTQVGDVACCVTVASVKDAPRVIPCDTSLERDAAVEPNAIVCDLWTNGAVNLTVLHKKRVLVAQTLQAQLASEEDKCGVFRTLPAKWQLGADDAGVVLSPD